ncbi:MAG: S1 RNA-binding domain-containing protein [Candidatus Parabeggiatoa sp.]|nr:S1 RNA-binding domain-containing protein [Candidatus Parabeggiatoa sp.]
MKLEEIEEGMVVSGVVETLPKYGALINLGEIIGLVHVKDMAWKHVKHPADILTLGETVDVKVLKVESERQRVSLSIKHLSENPWINIAQRYPEGTRKLGVVTGLTHFGCFIEIEDGIEGLVHQSDMDWTHKKVHPSRVVRKGEEVEVMVLSHDEEQGRIALGIKQCLPNPWVEFATAHKKYDKVMGKVSSTTHFGIFVGLEGEIDGLVHLSDISWDVPGEKAVRHYKKGDDVEVVILSIDSENQRISLGIKQLEDTLSEFIAEHRKGSIVRATISEMDEQKAILQLTNGIEGYIDISQFVPENIEDVRRILQDGDEVEAQFIGVDLTGGYLILSFCEETDEEEEETTRTES